MSEFSNEADRPPVDHGASEPTERSNLPWVMAALVIVIGGSKLDAARPWLGKGLALASPIVPMVLGLSRVEGGSIRLERAAKIVAWTTIIAGQLCVLQGFLQQTSLSPWMPGARVALYVALLAGLVVHVIEARANGNARFAGYVGIAVGFAVYSSDHPSEDPLAGFFVAFLIGVLVGGAALVAGALLARRLAKTP